MPPASRGQAARSPCSWPLRLALAACSRSGAGAAPAHPPPPPAAATVSGAGVVAEVNGAPILASELDQKAAGRLARLRQEEYEVRRQVLDELIAERLVAAEAAKRKVSPEELLRQEVDAKAEAPARGPARAHLRAEQGALRRPAARPGARAHPEVLGERAKAERRAAYETELRDAARVAVRLEAPRAAIEIPPGAPSTGPADAPVTIVEFTDYQCPYCHRAQGVIDQVLARYSGKVRLVHLDFPLDGHPRAVPAARAARCAGGAGQVLGVPPEPDDGARPARRRGPQGPRRRAPAEPRPVRELPGVGPPRRGHPGLARGRARGWASPAPRPTSSTAGCSPAPARSRASPR